MEMDEKKKDAPAPEPPKFGNPNEVKEFSVRVHVIEARELKSRDDGGTSDPICYVKVHDQKQKTAVMEKTLSALWDHCFFFTLKMNQAEFENCNIQFEVYDANTIYRNVMIGATAVDLAQVYMSPGHDMHKQWMALTDKSKDGEKGVQGYLNFSATVAPEGEPMPAPKEDDDEDVDFGSVNLQDLVLNGPDIQLIEYYVVAKFWQAFDLPAADKGGKSDPFIQVKFAGREHQTQVIKKTLDPKWNEELMIPCALPSLSDRIEVLCYDWDMVGSNDLICSKYFSFNKIKDGNWGPKWVYFYGVPGGDCSDKADPYNRGYKEGTAYRGRMLMQLSSFVTKDPRLQSKFMGGPPEMKYDDFQLLVDVYEGSEIVNTSGSVTLEFSIAHVKLPKVKSQTSKKGSAKFYAQVDGKIALPADTDFDAKDESPDLLIDCYTKNWMGIKSRSGYLRVPLKDIMGFNNPAKWYTLKTDDYGYTYAESERPGDILLKLDFGRWSQAPETRPHLAKIERKKFQLRAHIYQGRDLPAADSNGLSDPYCKIRCSGEQIKTERREETVNPTWYKTSVLDVELPTPLEYAPDVHCLVYDWDQLSGDDMIGRFSFPARDIGKEMWPSPRWFDLYCEDPLVTEGKMLVSFQLIPEEEAKEMKMGDITPKFIDCYFEINAVGLRDLIAYRMLDIMEPEIEFDTGDKRSRNKTKNTAKVSGGSADVLETVHLSVPLPVDEIYCPMVNVRVFDNRPIPLGGRCLVGAASIPMAPYLPWNQGKIKAEKHGLPRKVTYIPGARGSVNKNMPEEKKQADGDSDPLVTGATSDVAVDINEDIDADVPEQDIAGDVDDGEEEVESDEEEEKQTPSTDQELELLLADDLPFEEFKLYRGKARGLSFFEKLIALGNKAGSRQPAGKFKGRFRVIENSQLRYVDDPINLKSAYKKKKMVIRAYVLKGLSIVPHDDNGYSDPYLIIDTGVTRTKKKESPCIMKTQNPEFYHCFEVETVIPGPPLKIECWDHDDLSGDDIIGETIIDLENRVFCPKWAKMDPKMIEQRTLWTDVSKAPQGKLEMFVEVLTPADAKRIPPKNIAPPPPKPYELRIVVWETKNCAPKDGDKSDIFVSCQMADMPRSERQETDCHWNGEDGSGSFNWRMKFPMDLPYDNPRLKIQIWDKDLISANDIIAEATLNLKALFKKAWKHDKGFELNDKWISLYHPEHGDEIQGEVKVTVELLTKEMADSRPNGYRRDDPNQYPVLPPPDRPANSFNPLNPLGWAKLGAGALMGGMKKYIYMGVASAVLFGCIYMWVLFG